MRLFKSVRLGRLASPGGRREGGGERAAGVSRRCTAAIRPASGGEVEERRSGVSA